MCVQHPCEDTPMHQEKKTMSEVIKHKKDLDILKMSEDEEITVYTFLVVVPSPLLPSSQHD